MTTIDRSADMAAYLAITNYAAAAIFACLLLALTVRGAWRTDAGRATALSVFSWLVLSTAGLFRRWEHPDADAAAAAAWTIAVTIGAWRLARAVRGRPHD